MPRSVADTSTGSRHTNKTSRWIQSSIHPWEAALCRWFDSPELNEPYYEFVRRCVALCRLLCTVLLIRQLCHCTPLHCSCDKEAERRETFSSAGDRDAISGGEGGENIRWGKWRGVCRCGWNRCLYSGYNRWTGTDMVECVCVRWWIYFFIFTDFFLKERRKKAAVIRTSQQLLNNRTKYSECL